MSQVANVTTGGYDVAVTVLRRVLIQVRIETNKATRELWLNLREDEDPSALLERLREQFEDAIEDVL